MSKKPAIEQLLDTVREQLIKMSNPNHPAFKLVLERAGFGYDENQIPRVGEFVLRIEYVSTVAQLPVQGVSGLVLPQNMRGAPAPQAEASPMPTPAEQAMAMADQMQSPNADIGQSDQTNPTQP